MVKRTLPTNSKKVPPWHLDTVVRQLSCFELRLSEEHILIPGVVVYHAFAFEDHNKTIPALHRHQLF